MDSARKREGIRQLLFTCSLFHNFSKQFDNIGAEITCVYVVVGLGWAPKGICPKKDGQHSDSGSTSGNFSRSVSSSHKVSPTTWWPKRFCRWEAHITWRSEDHGPVWNLRVAMSSERGQLILACVSEDEIMDTMATASR